MTSQLMLQFVMTLLLLASTLVWHRGLPSVDACLRSLSALWKALRRPPAPPRYRRVAMRGARPWWE